MNRLEFLIKWWNKRQVFCCERDRYCFHQIFFGQLM